MMVHTKIALFVVACCQLTDAVSNIKCCDDFAFPGQCDFHQSLTYGAAQTANTANVKWVGSLTAGNNACDRQGVLRVIPPAGKTKAHVYLGICNPQHYTFNVADTSSNDGMGGGSLSNPSWVAEVHNVNQQLYIWEHVAWKKHGPPVPLNHFRHYFYEEGSTTWHLEHDCCNRVNMRTIPLIRGTRFRMKDDQMFEFDEFYVGLNRVVAHNGRSGTGACAVCIKFEDTPLTGRCNHAGTGFCKVCDGTTQKPTRSLCRNNTA